MVQALLGTALVLCVPDPQTWVCHRSEADVSILVWMSSAHRQKQTEAKSGEKVRIGRAGKLEEENQGEVDAGPAKARRPWILHWEDAADKAQVAHTVPRFKGAPR